MALHHVVISGPVGAGKSTLAQALAAELGWRYELESDATTNRFLAASVADPARWTFHSQMFFMTEAIAQQAMIRDLAEPVIQDRHLDEHLAMFSVPKHEQGALSDDEFCLLSALVSAGRRAVGVPDLLIYCHAPAGVVLDRIRSRGRDFEQALTLADVQAQCDRYDAFIAGWQRCPVLAADTSRVDVRDPVALADLAGTVGRALDESAQLTQLRDTVLAEGEDSPRFTTAEQKALEAAAHFADIHHLNGGLPDAQAALQSARDKLQLARA